MRLPRFEYARPVSIEEAVDRLERSGGSARILAGGTDLLVNMKLGVARPDLLVSLRGLSALQALSLDADGACEIGSAVTLGALAADRSLAERFPAFHGAVRSVASKQIRNVATLGGNLCLDTRCWHYQQSRLWREAREPCLKAGGSLCHAVKGSPRCHAINSSDTAPALLVHGALARLRSARGERSMPLRDLFADDGARPNLLEAGEILTSVSIPRPAPDTVAVFLKICARRGIDFAMASIAASVSGSPRSCREVRIAVGSVASMPLSLEKAAEVVRSNGLSEPGIAEAAKVGRSELGTVTNLFTEAGYKRQLVETLIRRALGEIASKMRKGGRA